MAIHVGIIDSDPVRLVTPVLHQQLPVSKLILIGTLEQDLEFERLTRVLAPKGIETEFFEISDDINIREVKSQVKQLAEQLSSASEDILFNASCGLRHQLLSAYEVFRTYQWPSYVIEPYSDELCWLYPDGLPQQQVEDHISLTEYLTVFGARCEHQDDQVSGCLTNDIYRLGEKWASNAYELGPGLATLNYLATTCRKEQRLDVALSEKQQGYRELGILLDDLSDAGLASYEQGVLTFSCEEARRFANGEWLESYVHHTVTSIQQELPTIQDSALSLQVYRQIGEREVRNELDVAMVVNNKLHIIECKTKGMSSDGDDTLYKLESLRDLLGGLQARAMLVSFRPLRHHDITRATDLGLALIGPDQLANLRTHLYDWFIAAGGTIEVRTS
ncbi:MULTISPECIES: Card1-like endonuclease domain-containing protein [unclassified Salinivibrio]|uniref:Card1-like endonuclease domain-containing protein n=1 Tax=unclassified Salinivibrio TaxID=2636825 RepID=UPI00128E2EF3|nr:MULTISPECIES: DUF1887 family CARF protein [unclassified Salinivibrio]MPS33118.1 DUF1887 family protein [Salinivibrio sp. VYel7]MPX91487.1 DUF1887 family protein [Salinivibrio sp. VYel1]MPX94504.1 DUF1887 family protein [Salinivibrio sp. VYel9]MPX95134.1 DUF1887 family protein [Salinivibrio sp. VYel6]MPY00745.1 DUF1887 family protein [Salinivibrio sp. VYel4]